MTLKSLRAVLFTKMAMEKGPDTRRCGLSGAKSTVVAIERLTDRNNAVDGAFYNAIKVEFHLAARTKGGPCQRIAFTQS